MDHEKKGAAERHGATRAPKPASPAAGRDTAVDRLGNRAVARALQRATSSSPGSGGSVPTGASGGEPLDSASRATFERRFGTDLGGVRIHAGPEAAESARGLGALAYTRGEDVVFGAGAFSPRTPSGRALLAHELTHVVQARAARSPSAAVSRTDEASEREAASVARGDSAPVRERTSGGIHRQPAPPPRAIAVIAPELDSDDASTRAAALAELTARSDVEAWSLLLRAQLSRFAEVRAGVDTALRAQGKTAAFRAFLHDQADHPRGIVSDLAVVALQSLGQSGPADPEDYRNVVRQRLDLVRIQVNALADDFADATQRVPIDPTKPAITGLSGGGLGPAAGPAALLVEVDALESDLGDATPEAMARIGVRSSLLLERLALLRPMVAGLKEQTAKLTDAGQLKTFIDTRLVTLLAATGEMTSETEDAASQAILGQIAQWPQDLVTELASQVHAQFADARAQIAGALDEKPRPSFEEAWAHFKAELLEPILPKVDALVARSTEIEKLAATDAAAALDDLKDLGPDIDDLGVRVQSTLAAIQMEASYTDLSLTDDAAKDLYLDTENDLKDLFAAFAEVAADQEHTPEERQAAFERLANSDTLKNAEADIKGWHEILDGELRFGMFVAEVGIVILSAYSAGIAGGLVRGLLGRGASLATRLVFGSLIVGAEATAFTATSRLLHVPFGGKLYDDKVLGELGQNALLFGIFKGAGAVYEGLVAPRLPAGFSKTALGVGKATLTFSFFQAWSVGLHAWDTGEWIGLGDRRFWEMAGQNVLFLGAVHVGMGITQPLMAPLTNKVAAFELSRHNARCAKLGESIEAFKNGKELDPKAALDITRRARTLYLERLDILRSINKADPKQLSDAELKEAETIIQAQVAAADETIFQSGAKMSAHESVPDTYYYEGDPEEVRDHYAKTRGFELVEIDAETGRMRLKDPNTGRVLDFIRTRLGTTGAGRRPTAAEAEKIYETIRGAKGDTSAIARNTGIPDGVLRIIRQHVFFKKHLIMDVATGKPTSRTFDADEDIARLWTAAMNGPLEGEDLAAFKRLMAHEYVEAMLVRSGMPYQNPKAWVLESGAWVYRPSPEHFGAHDLAPHVDPGTPAFKHYDFLKIPLGKAKHLPLAEWMGIPPEDLLQIDDARLGLAIAKLGGLLGLDGTRKLVALAARMNGDPALTGAIERIAALPDAAAKTQAMTLIDALSVKPEVPSAPERGPHFGEGGTSFVYDVKGHPELAVKPAGGRISKEAQAMVDLESIGVPTPYVARQIVEGTPSIVMQKIEGKGSKDIIGRVSNLLTVSESKNKEIVTQRTIDDLHRIYDLLIKNQINVGDFQFIVRSSDGAVFVNDPTGLTFGSQPSVKIKTIIEHFELILAFNEKHKK